MVTLPYGKIQALTNAVYSLQGFPEFPWNILDSRGYNQPGFLCTFPDVVPVADDSIMPPSPWEHRHHYLELET